MFKKLVIASAVLAASCNIGFASTVAYRGDYKCEAPCAPCAAPCPAPCAAPCATPCPCGAFYVGGSVGPRINVTGSPTNYTGLEGMLSLGYGAVFSQSFYLAGEFWGADSINLKNGHNFDQGTDSRSSWSWGGSALPGFMVNNTTMGFVRVGGQRTRFSNAGVTLSGWHVGVGAQSNIACNWDVRAEYIYSQYNSSAPTGGRPRSHFTNVGLVYKFM